MRVWRISNHTDLSARRGLATHGRWHRMGTPIIYCADHPSTSLLEILLHGDRMTVPDTFQLVEIEAPDDISVLDAVLPDGWQDDVEATRDIGSGFIAKGRAAFLRVPSVVLPQAQNLLLNPLHREAAALAIVATHRYPFGSRLLR